MYNAQVPDDDQFTGGVVLNINGDVSCGLEGGDTRDRDTGVEEGKGKRCPTVSADNWVVMEFR